MLAASPFEKGGWNSKTLFQPESVTHRLPEESKVSPPSPPIALFRVLAEGVASLLFPVVKLFLPRTILAFSPLENGVLNSRTRALVLSLTHKLPEESNARPAGLSRHDGLTIKL